MATEYTDNVCERLSWLTYRRLAMPLLEIAPMDDRQRFIADVRAGLYTMTELCERYGVTRNAGYNWLQRVE